MATATAAAAVPVVASAVASGAVSLPQAAAIASAVEVAPESAEALVELAKRKPLRVVQDEARRVRQQAIDPDRLAAAQRAARSFRRWRDELGMVRFAGSLLPADGVALLARLDRYTEARRRAARRAGVEEPWERHAADALLDLTAEPTTDALPAGRTAGGAEDTDAGDTGDGDTDTGGTADDTEAADGDTDTSGTADDTHTGDAGDTSGTADDTHTDDPGDRAADAGDVDGATTNAVAVGRSPVRRKRNAEVVFVIDLRAWRRGRAAPGEPCHVINGGPVTVAEIVSVLCDDDPFVKAVTHDGVAVQQVVHWGRRVPAHIRTALDLGEPPHFQGMRCRCGCGRRYKLQLDHIDPHNAGGATCLANLQPLTGTEHASKTERDRAAGLLHPDARPTPPARSRREPAGRAPRAKTPTPATARRSAKRSGDTPSEPDEPP